MHSIRTIHAVSAHAEGEVGDVIVGGVMPPPGDTLWDQRDWLESDGTLRAFMLNEPRGGVFRHVNLLVPAKTEPAQVGFLIMEPEDTPPMSGSNCMCVATVVLETGIVPMQEPMTELVLEAPAGLVHVRAECRDGRVKRVEIANVPSFVDRLDAPVEVEGIGTVMLDLAFGGDSYAIADATSLGFSVSPDEGHDIATTGQKIADAANEQLGFRHPTQPWDHISFCQIAGPLTREDGQLTGRNAVVIKPGKIDRSPCGTGSSARMAVMRARGQMRRDETFLSRSIIGSEFRCRIARETEAGGKAMIHPLISGRAWVTGTHQHMLDPNDPFPGGYKLSDTWPGAGR